MRARCREAPPFLSCLFLGPPVTSCVRVVPLVREPAVIRRWTIRLCALVSYSQRK
jgi:hypothetical protein